MRLSWPRILWIFTEFWQKNLRILWTLRQFCYER
jgi:hypothetical protein